MACARGLLSGVTRFNCCRQLHHLSGAQWFALQQQILYPDPKRRQGLRFWGSGRHLVRKPFKVHNVETRDPVTRVFEENAKKRGSKLKRKQNEPVQHVDEEDFLGKDADGYTILQTNNGEIKYKRLTAKDNLFADEMISAKSKGHRAGKHLVLEGKRLINDAIVAGVKVKRIFFCHVDMLQDLELPASGGTQFYKVYDRAMAVWSELTTPPGIIAVCKKPDMTAILNQQKEVLPLVVICDQVRDPGNMGAIMRSVAAAGCKMLITTAGCVNIWDGKVLRSSSGAQFHVPIYNNIQWPYIRNYLPEDFKVMLADNVGTVNSDAVLTSKPKHKPRKKQDDDDDELLDERSEIEVDESGLLNDVSYSDPEVLERFKSIKLPVEHFPNLRFSLELPTVLIIGGETTGLSLASRKLAYDYDGKIVSLPLCNNIESLNSGVACGILAFEMRRQFSTEGLEANRESSIKSKDRR